jgi:hypothetical protein
LPCTSRYGAALLRLSPQLGSSIARCTSMIKRGGATIGATYHACGVVFGLEVRRALRPSASRITFTCGTSAEPSCLRAERRTLDEMPRSKQWVGKRFFTSLL